MSLITSFTRPAPGGSEPTPPLPLLITPYSGASAAAWPSANLGIHVFFQIEKARRVTGLRIGIGAAAGNGKSGLYRSDGTNLTQLALSASTAVAGANATQDYLFTAAQDIVAGQPYTAFLAFDTVTTLTVWRMSVGAGGLIIPAGFNISGSVTAQFVTPTTPQAISGLSGTASGYTPVIALI
jgi:hypothetical protein